MNTKPIPMKRMHFFINEPLHKRLKTHAQKSGLPIADHLRRAVEQYLPSQPEKKA